jgi:hypothetical protein
MGGDFRLCSPEVRRGHDRFVMTTGPTVIAIGGHSLLSPDLPPTVANQFAGHCCVERSRGAAHRCGLVLRSDRFGEFIERCRDT